MRYRLVGYLVDAERYARGELGPMATAAICKPGECPSDAFRYGDDGGTLDHVHTPVGPVQLRHGDWLVKHPGDVLIVVDPEAFAITYRRVHEVEL